jgi:hypothetical protein
MNDKFIEEMINLPEWLKLTQILKGLTSLLAAILRVLSVPFILGAGDLDLPLSGADLYKSIS